jgi:transposase
VDRPRAARGRALQRLAHRHVIRALLRQHGYRVPSGSADSFIDRVRRLPLPGRLRSVVAPLLAVMCHVNQQLAYSDATIEHLAGQDPRVPRLRSVPGVGPVTAAAFLAAVDDAQRFPRPSARSLPRPRAPRVQLGRDAAPRPDHQGRARARWLLIQAARSILRCRPHAAEALWTWTLRIAVRRGKHVAIVALARRLAGILYALLRDGTVYAP